MWKNYVIGFLILYTCFVFISEIIDIFFLSYFYSLHLWDGNLVCRCCRSCLNFYQYNHTLQNALFIIFSAVLIEISKIFPFLKKYSFQAAASSPFPYSPLLPHLPIHRPLYPPHPSFLPFHHPSLPDFMKPVQEMHMRPSLSPTSPLRPSLSPTSPLRPSPPSPGSPPPIATNKEEEKNKNLFQPYLDQTKP